MLTMAQFVAVSCKRVIVTLSKDHLDQGWLQTIALIIDQPDSTLDFVLTSMYALVIDNT
jgi:hypothetical protein